MSVWRYAVWLMLWGGFAIAEETGFEEEGDGNASESVLADFREHGRFSLRWRIRGAELDDRGWQNYRRVEGEIGEGNEYYLLTERDERERRWADFAAFYLRWHRSDRPMEVVLGDLRPGWGAGMVFARNSGRSSLPLRQPGQDSERIGYRASGENDALRGVALRWRGKSLTGILIGGTARRDARVDEEGEVTSLPESGYHVTETEERGRDLLGMRVGGGRLRYRGEKWDLGGSLLGIAFGRMVDLRRPERKPWAFRGEGQRLLEVDGGVKWRMIRLRGEIARDGKGHGGAVLGIRVGLGKFRLRSVARTFDPGFHSFFGGAPSRGGMHNERGIMLVVEGKGFQIFADGYKRPERTYYYPLPTRVTASGLRLSRRLMRGLEGRVLVQMGRKPYWRDGRSVEETGRRIRLEIEHRQKRGMFTRLRMRIEGRRLTRKPGEEEAGLLGGLLWKGTWRWGYAILHFSGFSTDSYSTRIYEYEYDLPGAVSVRPLYGRGRRCYGLLGVERGIFAVGLRYRWQRDKEVRHYGGMQVDVELGK